MRTQKRHCCKLNKPDTSKVKYLNFEFEAGSYQVKSADGKVSIEGYANTVDRDRVKEIVLPKAFEKTLATYMKNPILLYMHDWGKAIGRIVIAKITDKGLWIKAEISNAKDVEDVRTKVQEKILKTFSIGYNEVKSRFDEKTKTKIIEELELLEISVVTIPANTEAEFSVVVPSEGKGADHTIILSKGVAAMISDQSLIPEVAKFIQSIKEKTMDAKKALEEAKAKKAEAEAAVTAAEAAVAAEAAAAAPATPPAAPAAPATDPAPVVDTKAAPAAPASNEPEEEDMMKVLQSVVEGQKAILGKLTELVDSAKATAGCGDGKPKPDENGKPKAADPGQTKDIEKMSEDEALEELEKVTTELEQIEG